MNACPLLIAWLASTGSPTGYDVYVDGLKAATVPTNQAELCITEIGQHSIYVVGFDAAGNRSVQSDALVIDVTAEPDPTQPPPTTTEPAMPCADLDGDGMVGMPDFGILAGQFGRQCP